MTSAGCSSEIRERGDVACWPYPDGRVGAHHRQLIGYQRTCRGRVTDCLLHRSCDLAGRGPPSAPWRPLGSQSTLASPSARWTPRVSGGDGHILPWRPWHPWAADLPPHPICPREPKGGGGRLPWSTTSDPLLMLDALPQGEGWPTATGAPATGCVYQPPMESLRLRVWARSVR